MNNNLIRIYHGSEYIIDNPQFNKGSLRNDYGRGFYCTEHIELAKEWACSHGTDGHANIYDLDLSGLNILELNQHPFNVLNWLAILADNRTYWEKNSISEDAKNYLKEHFLIDISPYDIIIGYRADDSYFTFAKNFVANTISLQQLKEAMLLGKLGDQVVLKSPRAFAQLHFLGAESAPADIYYSLKMNRDREARNEFRTNVRKRPNKNDLFMLDIMREEIKDGDPRLL